MFKKLKAALAAFLIAIMVIAWPLFIALSMATMIGFTIYKLIRLEQESEDK